MVSTKGLHFKKHSNQEVIDALRKHHGIISLAANELGINREGVRVRIMKNPKLKQVMQEARESIIDMAEDVMVQKLQAGNANMAQFALKNLGASRGYAEEHRFTGTLDANVNKVKADFSKLSLEEKLALKALLEKAR